MLIREYLSTLILLIMYMGYTWVWGSLIRKTTRQDIWFVVVYGLLLILPISMAIPWNIFTRISLWMLAVLLLWIYLRRPIKLPKWLWDQQFFMVYFGIVMILILMWAALSNEPLLWVWIGIPSLTANLLVIRRIWLGWNSQRWQV